MNTFQAQFHKFEFEPSEVVIDEDFVEAVNRLLRSIKMPIMLNLMARSAQLGLKSNLWKPALVNSRYLCHSILR